MLKKIEKKLEKSLPQYRSTQQVHRFRIILGKLDTIQYPHTNRGTTLIILVDPLVKH